MKKTLAADTPAGVLPDPRHSFWSRIAHEIGEAIRQGIYAPGERLPTEHALAQQYGVNRHTVRRSLATLGQLGLVRTSQGSGTYVEEFAVEVMLGKRTRHRQSLAQAGLKGGLRLLQTHVEEAEPGVAQALGLPAGAPVLHLVVLGDGADWIGNQAARHFGCSHQVPDWYHAKEHLVAAARLLKPEGTAAFTHWLNNRETRLYQGHALKVMRSRLPMS